MKKHFLAAFLAAFAFAFVAANIVWPAFVFEDPVGVYVDHFQHWGVAEEMEHPEYRALICHRHQHPVLVPKSWMGETPSYCGPILKSH